MNTVIEYESEFLKFIGCLEESDSVNHVVIIGSWAEYLYYKTGLLPGFEPDMSTIDLDVLVKNLRLPRKERNLIGIANENGFTYEEDYITGISRFFGRDQFEVEFLIARRGKGTDKLPRTKLGVNAQQLSHLSMLAEFTAQVNIGGQNLYVPTPEAYVLHKMIINNKRGLKAEKDRGKIAQLLPFMEEEKWDEIQERLSKKERQLIKQFMEDYPGVMQKAQVSNVAVNVQKETAEESILTQLQEASTEVRKSRTRTTSRKKNDLER